MRDAQRRRVAAQATGAAARWRDREPRVGRGGVGGELRVLLVDGDPATVRSHRRDVARVPGLAVRGTAQSRYAAREFLARGGVDLVLLDLCLPDGSGLELVRALRATPAQTDVMVVTDVRARAAVRRCMACGVLAYLLTPCAFRTLHDRLTRYVAFRALEGEADGQQGVDDALLALRAPSPVEPPKGAPAPTLVAVFDVLRRAGAEGVTAHTTGLAVGASRSTARRYLEHLAGSGRAERSPLYGRIGRPEVNYRWVPRHRDRQAGAARSVRGAPPAVHAAHDGEAPRCGHRPCA